MHTYCSSYSLQSRLLAQNPEVQQRLRAECVSLPSYKENNFPEKDEIKNMKYLRNVIHEGPKSKSILKPDPNKIKKLITPPVLRLFPPVPINMRQATKTTVLPLGGGPDASSPILVRKGEAVSYSVYAMHRRKDLYGDDADQFRPERWDPGSAQGPDLRNIGWGYLPFNGGPRVCLGRECDLSLAF